MARERVPKFLRASARHFFLQIICIILDDNGPFLTLLARERAPTSRSNQTQAHKNSRCACPDSCIPPGVFVSRRLAGSIDAMWRLWRHGPRVASPTTITGHAIDRPCVRGHVASQRV